MATPQEKPITQLFESIPFFVLLPWQKAAGSHAVRNQGLAYMCCNVCSTNLSLFGVPKILTFSWGRRRQSRNQRAHVQEESKLRYCARATNICFFTRNTLSHCLTLKHMLATAVQLELENPILGKSWITSMQSWIIAQRL